MPHFLRDRPTVAMADEVEQFSQALKQADPTDRTNRSRMLGQRGDLLRILGHTIEALADLREALELAGAGALRVRHQIRLGTAQFYGGDHGRAEATLRNAVEGAEAIGHEALVSFAHQHLGKCLAETRRSTEARELFARALEIRSRLGLASLAESSRQALEALEALDGHRDTEPGAGSPQL
jgi:tetratricopeptide (TPR) repeat protein